MKTLLLNQGQRIICDTHEPICLSHEIKVRLHYSAVSFGTEGNTSHGQKMNTIIKSKEKWQKAKKLILEQKKPMAAIRKFQNLKKVYECIGYSAVGEIIEMGRKVKKDFSTGDLVHVGGEFAAHQEIVSVPQNFCFKLENINPEYLLLYSIPTIMSVPYHGIAHSLDALIDKNKSNLTALVVGGGVIGTMAGFILRDKKFEVKFEDISANTLSDQYFDRVDNSDQFDVVLYCAPSMEGIESVLEQCRDGVVICVIGETELSAPREILEDKYATLRFCKSFGYGRGNKAYEYGLINLKESPFMHTISKNINECINLIPKISQELLQAVNCSNYDQIDLKSNKINILRWVKDER